MSIVAHVHECDAGCGARVDCDAGPGRPEGWESVHLSVSVAVTD